MKPRTQRAKHSNTHPETILLAVAGMSPAILTETIWALAEQKIVPRRVIVLTTSEGSARIQADLFQALPEFNGKTVWDTLGASLESKGFDISDSLKYEERILRLWNSSTRRYVELRDIRDASENSAAADFILEQIRGLVQIPDSQIIASIAGGRKTMGALLFSAMSLLGRETDRLTHVLVNEPYESGLIPRFYFPDQPSGDLQNRAGELFSAADAKIDLADVPFVPLRNLFERDLVKPPASFMELVARCRIRLSELQRSECTLEVRQSQPEIIVNRISVRISPAQYVIIRFLAEAARAKKTAINGYASAVDPVKELAKQLYLEHDKSDFSDWHYKIQPAKNGWDDLDERWLTRNLSELRTALKRSGLDSAALIPLLPETNRFSLDLDPRRIKFIH